MNESIKALAAEHPVSRRDVLRWSVAAPVALAFSRVALDTTNAEAAYKPFTLPPLPYSYSALSRSIDTRTMQLHHDKHHATYVKNLNAAVKKTPSLHGRSVQSMLISLNSVPENVRTAVRNNGGGHVNHTMFWEIMSPNGGGAPTGDIAPAIRKSFGSFETFKHKFNEAGGKRFGSGWVWLVSDGNEMKIISTPNQDNPLSMALFPIMGNDVWEHAYYLKYQNRRPDYLKAWWNVVNWNAVNSRLRYMEKSWARG